MKIFGYTLGQVKKAALTAAGFVVAVLTVVTQNNLVPEKYVPIALTVLGACTTAVVFLTKNADTDPAAEV